MISKQIRIALWRVMWHHHALMPRPLVRIKHWQTHPSHPWVVKFRQGGKPLTRYFRSRSAAQVFANQKHVELANEGRKHGEITDAERRAILSAREHNVDVAAAVDAFIAGVLHSPGRFQSSPQSTSSSRSCTGEGKSPVHLKDLRLRLGAFACDLEQRIVASITTKEIDAWLASLAVAPQTRTNYCRALHNFFAFATHRGYTPHNPVTAASKVKVPPRTIGILTVDQTRALLMACSREIVTPVAIGAFAGLRRAEIERLDWRQVDIARGFIEVTAAAAKSAQRRLVTISDNLQAWFSVSPLRDAGPVCPPITIYRRLFAKALDKAGIERWPTNALRHSFASHHLAFHRNASETALQLGHTESRTLFAHYRELVRAEEAGAYWRIFPFDNPHSYA